MIYHSIMVSVVRGLINIPSRSIGYGSREGKDGGSNV